MVLVINSTTPVQYPHFVLVMAIEVFSEISTAGISPRISFSHDLDQKDDSESISELHHHRRLDTSPLGSGSDFDFCIENSFVQELPSADELFCNGKILPIEIKRKQQPFVAVKQVHRSSTDQKQQHKNTAATGNNTGKKRLKEYLSMSIDADDHHHKPSLASKSFWQFKRSSSLNCESTRSKSIIRSSLDQFLHRSNSTGSAPNPKPTLFSKETQKQQHLQKQPSLSRKSSLSRTSSSSSSSGGGAAFYNNSTQKPPLKKKCGAYGNGSSVRFSPVLNLPHPFISNATVGFFGLGSIFCNGKAKKKKR